MPHINTKKETTSWITKQVTTEEGIKTVFKTVHVLKCSRCDKKIILNGPAGLPWSVIVSKFREKGWSVDPKRATGCFCRDCAPMKRHEPLNPVIKPEDLRVISGKTEEVKAMPVNSASSLGEALTRTFPISSTSTKEEPKPLYNLPIAPQSSAQPMTPIAAPMTSRQLRQVFTTLEMTFCMEGKIGKYLDGYSDERIAKDCGAPLSEVTRIRDEAFGPLEDPEIVSARGLFEKVTSEYCDLGVMLNSLSERLKKYAAVS